MEQQYNKMDMLDLILQPAFLVQNGVIVRVNEGAAALALTPGVSVYSILHAGRDEYTDFQSGCLYLTLQLCNSVQDASAIRLDGFDIFLLEEHSQQAELKAMALAAQNLREPLTSVMTMAERLFPTIEPRDDPAVSDQIGRINRGLFQMLRLLCNMSDADRYRHTSSDQQQTQNIQALMGELFERLCTMSAFSGIDLRFVNLQESLYTLMDAELLERAVYNMISNALKFTPKGGHIDAKLIRRDCRLYLTIQDSGSGIPEDRRSSLYSRFLRQPGLEDSRHGIGLGMVFIRAAAAAHGGTVLIEQPKGQGLCITMTLAIRQNRESVVRAPKLRVDYAGEWDHSLIELSDSLPASLYADDPQN